MSDQILLFNLTTGKNWKPNRCVHDSWDEFRAQVVTCVGKIDIGDTYVYFEKPMGSGGDSIARERKRLPAFPWRETVEPVRIWVLSDDWKTVRLRTT